MPKSRTMAKSKISGTTNPGQAEGHELNEAWREQRTLGKEDLRKTNPYWRAANYLSVEQIYLYDNPLLREPLTLAHVKPLVVGNWGTTPGQNFFYVHLNRAIKKYDLDMFYIAGPGHGGPALVGNTYLEGSCSEIYPDISRDEEGLKNLFKQFSFSGGIRFGMAVALMFVAILIYVLSDDLSWGPQLQFRNPH
jgi:phosphoketolase